MNNNNKSLTDNYVVVITLKFVRYVASTQFEVSNARMVFPCFDEPRFKANFTITIIHRDTMRSLSNTEVLKNVKRYAE